MHQTRRQGEAVSGSFNLYPEAPFRLDLAVWVLRRQGHNAVDRWDGREHGRTMALPTGTVDTRVHETGSPTRPRLAVRVYGRSANRPSVHREVECQLRRLLGLDAELDGFYTLAAAYPDLGALADRFRGMRPPRYAGLFETLANAIACQQVSLNVGITLLNRLATRFGAAGPDGFAFPHADKLLAGATPEDLRELGFSFSKARTLLSVAEACASGDLREADLASLTDAEAINRLTAIRGIGRWSAEYALLRGLGRLHVLPGDDVGAQRHLAQWLKLSRKPGYAEAYAALQHWREYAGLIYLHLLLLRLDPAGE